MISIRRELLVWTLWGFVIAGALASIGTYFLVHSTVDKFYADELGLFSSALVHSLPAAKSEAIDSADSGQAESRIVIQVRRADGTLIFGMPGAPDPPPTDQSGYTHQSIESYQWHIYTRNLGDRYLVVAHKTNPGGEVPELAALQSALPALVLIPVLGLFFIFAIRRSFAPLDEIVSATARRNADHLTPLPMHAVPAEIAPLVGEMNKLLARLAKSIELQRRFVADAAHELRMPLAALQLELNNVQTAVADHRALEGLARLETRIRRAARLVNQLLSMARQEGADAAAKFDTVDLSALLKECLVDLVPLADTKRIDLGMRSDAPARIMGDHEALRLLFANLVDNAIRYTPEGGTVDIGLRLEGKSAVVEVTDTGPGIPSEQLPHVFDRFFRIEGSGADGCGLGLSIAKAIADRHNAAIRLANRPVGGTLAEVTFPDRQEGT